MSGPPSHVLLAIEHNRKRLWAICYRMTGRIADADDFAHDAIARALERADQCRDPDATGWLIRLTTRVCIDRLRRARIERRSNELVDPLEDAGVPQTNPEEAAILRDDLRFAVIVALQALSPKQRAALILRDVCDRSLAEVAETLGTNPNAAKALLQRARVALRDARHRCDTDVPVDAALVERFARAIEVGSVAAITTLFADDVWGVTDAGALAGSKKPTYGARAVARQWSNAKRRLGDQELHADIRMINGEAAIVVRLADIPIALVHLESRRGLVAAVRAIRDPEKLARLGRVPAPLARSSSRV